MKISSLGRWLRARGPLPAARPLFISIDVSDRCNLRCTMCRAWRDGSRSGVMAPGTFSSVLANLNGLEDRELVLIGAEPTLNPDLVDLVRLAAARGFATRLFTNGGQLDGRLADELIAAGLRSATVSIDGATPATHDQLRGVAGAHARAMGAIRALASGHHKGRIQVSTNTLVTTGSWRELPDLVGLVRDAGAERLSFQLPSQVPGHLCAQVAGSQQYRQSESADLLFDQDSVELVRSSLSRVARLSRSPSAAVMATFPREAFLEGTFPIRGCRYARISLNIDSSGNAYPCSHFQCNGLGSLVTRNWQEVWQNRARLAFLDDLSGGLHEVCNYCCHYIHNLSLIRLVRGVLR